MSEETFDIKYGLIVVDAKGSVYHFCGYETEPTKEMETDLLIELHEDPEFNYISSSLDNKTMILEKATKELVKYFRKKYNKGSVR